MTHHQIETELALAHPRIQMVRRTQANSLLQKRDELSAQSARLTSLNERILRTRAHIETRSSSHVRVASRSGPAEDVVRDVSAPRADDASLSTVAPSVDNALTRMSTSPSRPRRPRTVEGLYQTVSETSSLSPTRRRRRGAPKPHLLAARDAPLSVGDGATLEESSGSASPSHARRIPERRRSCDIRSEYGKKVLERETRRSLRRMSAQLICVEPAETLAFLEAGEACPNSNICVDNLADCDLSEVSEMSELSEASYHYEDPFIQDISRTRGSPAEEVERLMEQGQAVHLEPKEFNILNARGFVDDHIFNSLVHKQARRAQYDAEMEALYEKRGGGSGLRRRRQSQLAAASVSPITRTGDI